MAAIYLFMYLLFTNVYNKYVFCGSVTFSLCILLNKNKNKKILREVKVGHRKLINLYRTPRVNLANLFPRYFTSVSLNTLSCLYTYNT